MKYKQILILLCIVIYSCQKDSTVSNNNSTLASLTTSAATGITTSGAISGGNITNDGGATVTARGVCWSTSHNPTTSGSHTTDGTGTGAFTSLLSGLAGTTTYYVRAYAVNSAGTEYGQEISLTTIAGTAIPTITTTAISAITSTSASSGGNITNDGGATVTARGICWSTSASPVVSGNHTTDGTGIGIFTSSMAALSANTMYYTRAYATNSIGTAYGNELSFTTSASGPDVYVGGHDGIIPIVWKNGVGTPLQAIGSGSRVLGLFIENTDVYAAGAAATGVSHNDPVLWKNGSLVSLPANPCANTPILALTAVLVSGTDVYMGGYEAPPVTCGSACPVTWKNGVITYLPMDAIGTNNGGEVYSIAISGSDFYAAGADNTVTGSVAKIWKNGVGTAISTSAWASAQAISVVGTDIYAAGYEYSPPNKVATVWKNGTGTPLSNVTNAAVGNSIFVSGSDVYVAGYEDLAGVHRAVVWKNGVATYLTNGTNGGVATSVFIYGTDVYVAGYENTGGPDVAKYWKNGVPTVLSNSGIVSRAWSIIVK